MRDKNIRTQDEPPHESACDDVRQISLCGDEEHTQNDTVPASSTCCDEQRDGDVSLSDIVSALDRIAEEQKQQTAVLRSILDEMRHPGRHAQVETVRDTMRFISENGIGE